MDGRESLYANVKYDILQYNAAVPAPCSGKIQVAERILIYEGHVRRANLLWVQIVLRSHFRSVSGWRHGDYECLSSELFYAGPPHIICKSSYFEGLKLFRGLLMVLIINSVQVWLCSVESYLSSFSHFVYQNSIHTGTLEPAPMLAIAFQG